MTRFSVCINAYNADKFLKNAIDSVLNQDFDDYELIILDDASTDDTAKIIKKCESKNEHVKGIYKKENGGLYLGRRDVVENCKGEYTLFLDSDDAMEEGLLKKLDRALLLDEVDMFHYGVVVRGHDVGYEQCDAFQAFCNVPVAKLQGDDVLNAVFGGEGEFQQDWQLPQRAFRTAVLKRAFKLMKDVRLDCAEDAYEMFVICALVKHEATNNDIKGLVYNYGLGLNGQSSWSAEKFARVAKAFSVCADEIDGFANEFNKDVLRKNARTARVKLMDLLFNDWHTRVTDNEKLQAAKDCVEFLDGDVIATQITRCVRDDAYSAITSGGTIKGYEHLKTWLEFSSQLMTKENRYYSAAKKNIEVLEQRALTAEYNKQKDLRIFVSAHKDVDLFDSDILQPVQVGASNATWRFPTYLQDDSGENIAELNPMYCELTAQYWAWKNVDCKYLGFCHYRRYFNFSDNEYEENDFGEIIDTRINSKTQKKYGLSDKVLLKSVGDYDIITTKFQDLRDFPGDFNTPREHWCDAPHLQNEDLDLLVKIVKEMHPDYAEACEKYLNGNKTCFCNMFVMKKEIFDDYCSWLFPILEKFCEERDMTHYSKEALRTPGHLGERLLNIYIIKHKLGGTNWKHKQVQCVHFEKPDKLGFPPLNFDNSQQNKQTIPVVLAAGDNYVPMIATTIYSMMKNASEDYKYDVVVLNNNIAWEKTETMVKFFSRFKNMSLRFFNVEALVEDYALQTSNCHIGAETYYRFLIQDVLPQYDKVLYLDSDMIIEGDVSDLFETDIEDKFLAAVSDIDFLGNLNFKDNERAEYNRDVLHMNDPYSYFQAGVLLLNTKKLRELHTITEWLDLTSNEDLIYNDQDILNMECEGRVEFLPMQWNVMHNCAGRVEKVFTFAPASELDKYFSARTDPKVVHYAGFQKPWIYCNVDMEEHFWKYAKETPFYQTLLDTRAKEQIDFKGAQITVEIDTKIDTRFDRHQKLYHPVLNIASKVVPRLRKMMR